MEFSDVPFGRKETFIELSCLCFYFSLYLISTYLPTSSSKNNSTNTNSRDYSRSPINFILPQKELIIKAYNYIYFTVNQCLVSVLKFLFILFQYHQLNLSFLVLKKKNVSLNSFKYLSHPKVNPENSASFNPALWLRSFSPGSTHVDFCYPRLM